MRSPCATETCEAFERHGGAEDSSLCTGLCCAALLARYGNRVTVCESHYHPGGAAQSFEVKGHHFDGGPSFFAGLTGRPLPLHCLTVCAFRCRYYSLRRKLHYACVSSADCRLCLWFQPWTHVLRHMRRGLACSSSIGRAIGPGCSCGNGMRLCGCRGKGGRVQSPEAGFGCYWRVSGLRDI